MTDEIEKKISDFDALSTRAKWMTLIQAEKFQQYIKCEHEVLNTMYKKGELHHVIAIIEEIAIVKSTKKSSEAHPYTASVFIDGKWKPTSSYYPSIEYALLGAIGYKNEGGNSRFDVYAGAMIGLDKVNNKKEG